MNKVKSAFKNLMAANYF